MERSSVVFRSIHHPGGAPYSTVFADAVSRPIAALFLPVMIVCLVAALRNASLLVYLVWGFPAATVAAFLWTAFSLRRTLAEIRVAVGAVTILSVRDVAVRRRRPHEVLPLFDVRNYGRWLVVAAGDADYIFHDSEWPQFGELKVALDSGAYPELAN